MMNLPRSINHGLRTLTRPHVLLSLAIFIAAVWLYRSTLQPGIIFDGGVSIDSAELQRVAYRLGIAHSTGYPIWSVIAHFAAKIEQSLGGSPYTGVTMVSALMSAAALTLFFQAARLVGRTPAALAATAAVAFADSVWSASTIAEVQTMHTLIIAGMLWLSLLHLRRPEKFWPLAALALLAGIGLAHHRTIVLVFPAAGLAVLMTGRWRLKWREIAIMLILGALPLLSYAYLYWRVTDPNVVFSTRPTWYPSPLTTQSITDLIRGTFQDGQSLNNNFDLSPALLGDNFLFVLRRLVDDFTIFGVIGGLIGLVALLFMRWKDGLLIGIYAALQLIFLMAWKIDDPKSPIYQFPMLLALGFGLTVLFSGLQRNKATSLSVRGSPKKFIGNRSWRSWCLGGSINSILLALFSLPIFALAFHLGFENQADHDFSVDNRTARYQAELASLPEDAILFTRMWQPETFIMLEYLDTSNRRSPLPAGTDLFWVPLDQMKNPTLNAYVGISWRSSYGLYDGATWFQQEQGIAFAGTDTETFLQAMAWDDPRLFQQANRELLINQIIAPQVELYSYSVSHRPDGFYITLYWKANAPMTESYAVYTHLRLYGTVCDINTVQTLLGQDDSYAPVQGTMPTHIWQEGQFVRDTYFIRWQGDPPENSALAFGMTLNGERTGEFCVPLGGE